MPVCHRLRECWAASPQQAGFVCFLEGTGTPVPPHSGTGHNPETKGGIGSGLQRLLRSNNLRGQGVIGRRRLGQRLGERPL